MHKAKIAIIAFSSPTRCELEQLDEYYRQLELCWPDNQIVMYDSCYHQNYYETVTSKQKVKSLSMHY